MRNTLFEELIERDQLREVAEEAMNASLGTTMFGMVVPETQLSRVGVKGK
jgi:hypothetical protein